VGGGRFRGFSAGSHPAGKVNPFALELLQRRGLAVGDLRSKSWDEFAAPAAPRMDLVITVCDNAAGESCPVWPGAPLSAHWDTEDPAAVEGTDEEKRKAFAGAFESLHRRISLLADLPLGELDADAAKRRLAEIELFGRAGKP
jgi:arsenate reductase